MSDTLTSIRNRYVMADLTFTKPQMTKTDRKAQRQVEVTNNACGGVKVVRSLWAKADIDPFVSNENETRAYLRSRTVAMGDSGLRLLNVANDMMTVVQRIEQHYFVEREQLRTAFAIDYAAKLATAEQVLGGLFDPTVYPDVSEVVNQFQQRLDIYPVGSIGEGMFDQLEADLASEVSERVRRTTEANMQETVREPLSRIVQAIMNLHNKVVRPDSRIHERVMNELSELCDAMPSLNVLGLPELDQLAAKAAAELLSPVTTIRDKDSPRREEIRNSAGSMLKDLGINPLYNAQVTDPTERKTAALDAAQKILDSMKVGA